MRSVRRSVFAFAAPLATAALLLTACGSSDTATTTAPATSDTPSPTASTTPAAEETPDDAAGVEDDAARPGAYIDFSQYQGNEAMYANGDTVLFFHASWCPTCQAAEKNITAAGENLPEGLTIVKVDYDTANDLRQKYGVTIQHTFVQVDQDGNELNKWTTSLTPEDIKSKVV